MRLPGPMGHPGLLARVTAGFAVGALILSASMAVLSYQLTRNFLVTGRERTAVRAANFDASVVRAGLSADNPDVVDVLRSLDTGKTRRALLYRDGRWYARSSDLGDTRAVSGSLRRMVEQDRPGIQRIRVNGRPVIVIGVPLSATTALYEIDALDELERTLRTLSGVLTAVAAVVAVAGAGLGRYAARRVLRPLRSVATAAQEIAAGDLAARLEPATDPDLRRLTSSFNHMVDQLSQRMQRDRRFAADVSHELRSPVQTLAAAASVLARRREHLDERTATAATLVAEEIARFQDLIADLLELAGGDRPVERTEVDMPDLARQVCRSKGVPPDIVVADAGSDDRWLVDRRRFTQILSNLLDNAERHGGGPVTVRLGSTREIRYLEVDDEGPGVRPEDREAIFDRFVRGRPATARQDSHGTGLGLALVAQHVAAHGGRAEVTDRPGGGARFRIELSVEVP